LKHLIYISHLIILILPGSVEDYFLVELYGFSYPIQTILLPFFYFDNILKNRINLLFTVFYILLSLIISSYYEENTVILFLYTLLVLRFDHNFTQNNSRLLKVSLLSSVLILTFQLIFQFVGTYRVDYGVDILNKGFHTTAGDPNFSGFIIAFFGYIYFKFFRDKSLLNYAFLILMVFGVLLTESRGATLLLLPTVLIAIRFFNVSNKYKILIVISLTLCLYLLVNSYNDLFSKWNKIDHNLTLEVVSSGRNNRIEESLEYIDIFTFLNLKTNVVPYHFVVKDSIFAPHNFYLAVFLSFGLTSIFIIYFFLKKFFLGFKTSDYNHKIFLFFVFFIIANIESYFLNVYVLYLITPWLIIDKVKS